jgi:hypothetical protein
LKSEKGSKGLTRKRELWARDDVDPGWHVELEVPNATLLTLRLYLRDAPDPPKVRQVYRIAALLTFDVKIFPASFAF